MGVDGLWKCSRLAGGRERPLAASIPGFRVKGVPVGCFPKIIQGVEGQMWWESLNHDRSLVG